MEVSIETSMDKLDRLTPQDIYYLHTLYYYKDLHCMHSLVLFFVSSSTCKIEYILLKDKFHNTLLHSTYLLTCLLLRLLLEIGSP